MVRVQFRKVVDNKDRLQRIIGAWSEFTAGLIYPMVRDVEALALAGHGAFDTDKFLQSHLCFFRVQRQRLIIFRR